jgi:hypothetical protein
VTLIDDGPDDLIAELERMDRFFAGEEAGDVPLEILRARGIDIPRVPPADAAALRAKLWELIEAMAGIGVLIESTDHLSDGELYRYLVEEALLEETVLSSSAGGTWHISPIGGGSEEDSAIYLRYYADDEERERWHREFGDPLPPKEKLPFDRDRFLPGHEPVGTAGPT